MRQSRLFLALALLAGPALADNAPPPSPPPVPYGAPVGLETARRCVQAAEAAARQHQWFMVVTVVDAGGHEVLTERMDNAQIGSLKAAKEKAYTAVAFRRSTKQFEDMVAQGGPALRILRLPDALPIEGGLPLVQDGHVVGAVGASGGSAQQDGVVAEACVQALAH